MKRWFPRVAMSIAVALAWVSFASACPFCQSDTGQQVRAGIFGEDFAYNLMATILPFVLFLAIVAAIHFGVPWPKDASRIDATSDKDESQNG